MEIKAFVKEWKNKGDVEQNQFNKFFSYYIALNVLYENEFPEISSEKGKLSSLVSKYICNPHFTLTINMQNYSHLTDHQLLNMRTNKNCKLYKLEDLKQGNIFSIFMAIYQIRCNLFHGGKCIRNENDVNIVSDANDILKQFLEKYLELPNE